MKKPLNKHKVKKKTIINSVCCYLTVFLLCQCDHSHAVLVLAAIQNKALSIFSFVYGKTLFSTRRYSRHHGSRATLSGEFKVMNGEVWPAVNHDNEMQVPHAQNVLTQRKQYAPLIFKGLVHIRQRVHNDTTKLTSESKIYN